MSRKIRGKEGYFVVAVSSDVVENNLTLARAGDRKVLLSRVNGVVIAADRHCPHASADLSKGSLNRNKLCCHEHDYCFELSSGRIMWPDDEPYRLRLYDVREEDGVVKIRI